MSAAMAYFISYSFHVFICSLGEKKNPIIVLITITLRLLDWFIHVEYQQLWSTILARLP